VSARKSEPRLRTAADSEPATALVAELRELASILREATDNIIESHTNSDTTLKHEALLGALRAVAEVRYLLGAQASKLEQAGVLADGGSP
jgi:hypothetical protein